MKTCQRSKVASRCESARRTVVFGAFFSSSSVQKPYDWVSVQSVMYSNALQLHADAPSTLFFVLVRGDKTSPVPSRHEDAAVTGAERERARWLEHLLMNHNIIMLVLTKCVLLQASCWRRRPAAEASWMFIFLFPVEFSGGFVGRTGSRSLRVFFFFPLSCFLVFTLLFLFGRKMFSGL